MRCMGSAACARKSSDKHIRRACSATNTVEETLSLPPHTSTQSSRECPSSSMTWGYWRETSADHCGAVHNRSCAAWLLLVIPTRTLLFFCAGAPRQACRDRGPSSERTCVLESSGVANEVATNVFVQRRIPGKVDVLNLLEASEEAKQLPVFDTAQMSDPQRFGKVWCSSFRRTPGKIETEVRISVSHRHTSKSGNA